MGKQPLRQSSDSVHCLQEVGLSRTSPMPSRAALGRYWGTGVRSLWTRFGQAGPAAKSRGNLLNLSSLCRSPHDVWIRSLNVDPLLTCWSAASYISLWPAPIQFNVTHIWASQANTGKSNQGDLQAKFRKDDNNHQRVISAPIPCCYKIPGYSRTQSAIGWEADSYALRTGKIFMKSCRQPQETGLCPRIGDGDPPTFKFNIWANELLDINIVLYDQDSQMINFSFCGSRSIVR